MAEVLTLGDYIAEELQARGWEPRDFAWRIENARAREIDGQLVKDLQVRELEIELVIACSDDRSCCSSEESLKAFARGLGTDWRFLDALQKRYRDGKEEAK